MFCFTCEGTDGLARAGRVEVDGKTFSTPAFMPVASHGAVRTLQAQEVGDLGADIILGNALHLSVRPGVEIIEQHGGIGVFMKWSGPVLTDSGGYQVFSLSSSRRISEDGVEFTSPFDGSKHFVTPESVVDIQRRLGSDIAMPLDHCPALPADMREIEDSVLRTRRWLERCVKEAERQDVNLFGIFQGGTSVSLRKRSLEMTLELPLAGIAVGGLSVGEPAEEMYEVLEQVVPLMPSDRPRYLMGVGTPENIIKAVGFGIDMFDCVLPTRNARNGQVFTWSGKLNLLNARFKKDFSPIDERCGCPVCLNYTRSYLRHLLSIKEMLGPRLLTVHNLHFYFSLIKGARRAILEGRFREFSDQVLSEMNKGGDSA